MVGDGNLWGEKLEESSLSTTLGPEFQAEQLVEHLCGPAGRGAYIVSDGGIRNTPKGSRRCGGTKEGGRGGTIYVKMRDWRQGQTCQGGGSPMVNQLGESEGGKGREEFQAAGFQHQLQLQVAELVGVVRDLAQQVNQTKVEVGGVGVIGEKVWDVTSGRQIEWRGGRGWK